ncbi:uncharacterized protein LOC122814906 [Protopterus annectens]|uniref:uncharacterized protein LOC122814906 n=1 Tax=Protopterus annectens TaxID=7888 RepID=UPI001CFA2249|nr:uncharacterized protein LOC122814906 [Protopterus annectens]
MVRTLVFCCLLGFTTQISASSANHNLTIVYAGTNANLQCKYQRGFSNSIVTWHDGNGNNINLTVSTNYIPNEGTIEITSNVSLKIEGETKICCSVTLKKAHQNSTICKTVKAVNTHNGIGSTITTLESAIVIIGIVIVVVFILCCHRGFISRGDQLMHNGYQRGVSVSRYSVSNDVEACREEKNINESDYYFNDPDSIPLHGKENSSHV